MPNVLGVYNPTFFAQEALEQLEKVLGMAFFVHRGFDPSPTQRGDTISIRRPGVFTAAAMPIATASDLETETVSIVLDAWEGVVFSLTDKELSHTKERIIDEHIRPAAIAVADSIDQDLAGLYVDVPFFLDASDPGAISDFTGVRKLMFDNKVPTRPRSLMLNGEREADYLELEVFHSAEKGVDAELAQREGFLGRKFGFDIFANQNVATHVTGTVVSGSDQLGAVVGAHLKGVTALAVDSFAPTETFKRGDTFTIAGDLQRYAVAADATLSGGAITLSITPSLQIAVSGTEVITVRVQTLLEENLAWYRNAFALAMAPLSDVGNAAGARMGIAIDPKTALSLRSRLWYEGKEAAVFVGIDALWGVKTLNGNMAIRLNS